MAFNKVIEKILHKLVFPVILFLFILTSLSLVFVIAPILLDTAETPFRSDYLSYLTGASIILSGNGSQLYDLNIQDSLFRREWGGVGTLLPFKTMPVAAVLYIPFTFLSVKIGIFVTLLINVFLLLLIARQFFSKFSKNWIPMLLTFSFLPILPALLNAQLSFLLGLLLAITYKWRGKEFIQGLLIGMLSLKLQYLVPSGLFFFVISENKKKFISGFLLSSIMLVITSMTIAGVSFPFDYARFVFSTENASFGSHGSYYSLWPLLRLITKNNISAMYGLITNYCLMAVFALFLYKREKQFSYDKKFIIGSIALFLFAFHTLENDLLLLLPAVILSTANFFANETRSIAVSIKSILLFMYPLVFIDYFLFGVYTQSTTFIALFSSLKSVILFGWLFWEVTEKEVIRT